MEVWEKREIAWEHEHEVRVFPRNFEFLPNFHKCFYKHYRNTENVFYFFINKCIIKNDSKQRKKFFYFFINKYQLKTIVNIIKNVARKYFFKETK
jgi:hypothetical protein